MKKVYYAKEKYGLVWGNEKKEQIVKDCKNKLPILERIKEKKLLQINLNL